MLTVKTSLQSFVSNLFGALAVSCRLSRGATKPFQLLKGSGLDLVEIPLITLALKCFKRSDFSALRPRRNGATREFACRAELLHVILFRHSNNRIQEKASKRILFH